MAEYVTIRHPDGTADHPERTVPLASFPFFKSQGYVALDAAGRVKAKQPTTASDNTKEN